MNKEIEIPEGYEARIEGNKIILELKESEDEKIRKTLLRCCDDWEKGQFGCMAKEDVPAIRAYLEKQKEQKTAVEEVLIKAGLKSFKDGNQWCILVGDNIQEGVCGFGDTIEDALYEFLKEVCEQQKPAEWSEKDKIHLNNAILVAKKEWGVNSYTARWLESLRDNYKKCNCRWKPSEEQMAALLNAEGLVRANNYPENAKILASLYTDLKKL